MSTYINLHNGAPHTTNFTSDDVRAGYIEVAARWPVLVSAMDDAIREQVHGELAPCTERTFLARYLELATEPLVVG